MKKQKGLFPEKYLWGKEACSWIVNHALISDYAGLKRLTEKRLKVMKNEKTALNLFLRKKECWKTTILCKFLCLLTFTLIVFVPYKFWLGIVYEIVVIDSKIGKVDAIILENRGEEDKNVELTGEPWLY